MRGGSAAARLLMVSAVLFQCLVETDAAPAQDEILYLPGFGVPPTKQYSGYLDAKDGCDPKEDVCRLHYWFCSAEGDASSKPLVLWLNGGPGASSVAGMLSENGPLLINATGGLMENPYSWTKLANLVVLEAPVGVGYSYCSSQMDSGLCHNTDKLTASASRAALVDLYKNKFPELKKNDFFITGESYAGVYIPTLAKELLDNAKGLVPLKGIAVGDPCTDTVAQSDSMDALWYGHKMGLVADQQFDFLWNTCGARDPNVQALGGNYLLRSKMKSDVSKAHLHTLLRNARFRKSKTQKPSPACKAAYRKYLVSSSKGLSQEWSKQWINDYSLFGPAAQVDEDQQMSMWMMRDDVRKALHVEASPAKLWPEAEQGFDYSMDYAACNADYAPGTPSMIDFYREIAPKLDITVVYNGDTDPCVSYEGTRTAISRVGFAELDGGGYRPWFFNHSAAALDIITEKAATFGPDLNVRATGAQFGGEIVNYEHNLQFVTFHGSGHMVPAFRPQAALHFLRKVISLEPLSPLMPKNATMTSMTEKEFDRFLDKWTDLAKSPPYVSGEAMLQLDMPLLSLDVVLS